MADFSARSQTLRDNERTKHFAGVLTAWGTHSLIAAFAKVGSRLASTSIA